MKDEYRPSTEDQRVLDIAIMNKKRTIKITRTGIDRDRALYHDVDNNEITNNNQYHRSNNRASC
jgi:hypothetical protein